MRAPAGGTRSGTKLLSMAVEVWMCDLREVGDDASRLRELLSPDEKARLSACGNEGARRRFLAGRGLLRALLAEKLQRAPEELRFVYSDGGKPALDPAAGGIRIAFNLSHSRDLLLIALADEPGVGLGVDVEWTGAARPFEAIAGRFGAPGELEAFRAVPQGERRRAFYRWWTRKEAVVKGAGARLAGALGLLEVPLGPEAACEVAWPPQGAPGSGPEGRWLVYTWEVVRDYIASLAVSGAGVSAEETDFAASQAGAPHSWLPLRLAAVLVLPGSLTLR